MKINSISTNSAAFPEKITTIPNAPTKLYVCGTLPVAATPCVAIVGTRKPTAYGRTVTEQLAGGLASRGVCIISGLALGIDSIAHQAALSGGGQTVAVLPSSVDRPYPRTHHRLAEAIITGGGALLSEYTHNPSPSKWHFLARNRLVSGLSDALIVTEATVRSGTMSTVAHALAQGRDVYAVPGPITSPSSAGCNQLISQGAVPIIDVEAFLTDIAPRPTEQNPQFTYDDYEATIVNLLQEGVADGEQLQEKSRLEPALFHQTMTMLEIRGAIKALGGNQWRL